MLTYQQENELRDLIDAMCEDGLGAEQAARIESLVNGDDAACRFYLDYLNLHGMLVLDHAGDDPVDAMLLVHDRRRAEGSEKDAPSEEEAGAEGSPVLGFLGDCWQQGTGWLGKTTPLTLALTALLVPAVLAVLALSVVPLYHGRVPEERLAAGWPFVAQVAETADCQWVNPDASPDQRIYLLAGQPLQLAEGLAEIRFGSGATVILQGPTTFVPKNDASGLLAAGRLTAKVPPAAVGFTIETPGMRVVDLGTEFGVEVDQQGDATVHVFLGKVEVAVEPRVSVETLPPEQPAPRTQKVLLTKDETIRVAAASDVIEKEAPIRNRFVRRMPPRRGVTAKLALRNPGFEIPDIRLHPRFSQEYGYLGAIPIAGWETSRPNSPDNRLGIFYQVSPYRSLYDLCGPEATEGAQTLAVQLSTNAQRQAGDGPLEKWVFQSLGIVQPGDVGRALEVRADVAAREPYRGKRDGARATLAFTTGTSPASPGDVVGRAETSPELRKGDGFHELGATLTIDRRLVHKELFVRMLLRDDHSGSGYDQYLVDHFRLGSRE